MAVLEVAFLGLLYLLAGRKPWSHRALLAAAVLAPGCYLVWRVSDTLVFTAPSIALSVALVLGESIGSAHQMLWTVLMRNPARPSPGARETDLPLPAVDVFVTMRDEDLDALQLTLTACAGMSFPTGRLTVHVLDEGNRKGTRRLARQFGAGYLAAAPTPDRGRVLLNRALDRTSGSLILLLDAGAAPGPHVVQRMCVPFRDPMMGFVQAPRAPARAGAIRHGPGIQTAILSEQECVLGELFAAHDRSGAALFAGGNALFARAALQAIGGFPDGGILGDLSTSLLVHGRGYQSVSIDEVMPVEAPPESFRTALRQRVGWARGYIRSWRVHRPLRLKDLSARQRLAYLTGLLHGYACLQKLVYTVTPILCLNLGLVAWHAAPAQLMVVWLPALVGAGLALRAIGARRRAPFWSHAYDAAVMCPLAWAVIAETLRLRPPASRTVRDDRAASQNGVVQSAFLPLLVLCMLTLSGIAQGLLALNAHFSLSAFSAITANIAWSGYNMCGLVVGLLITADRPQTAIGVRQRIARCTTSARRRR